MTGPPRSDPSSDRTHGSPYSWIRCQAVVGPWISDVASSHVIHHQIALRYCKPVEVVRAAIEARRADHTSDVKPVRTEAILNFDAFCPAVAQGRARL